MSRPSTALGVVVAPVWGQCHLAVAWGPGGGAGPGLLGESPHTWFSQGGQPTAGLGWREGALPFHSHVGSERETQRPVTETLLQLKSSAAEGRFESHKVSVREVPGSKWLSGCSTRLPQAPDVWPQASAPGIPDERSRGGPDIFIRTSA